MFERFTDHARQVVVLAQGEARSLRHGRIGTEHLLLGLLAEDRGVAARVLADLGVEREAVHAEVVRIVGSGALAQPDAEALRTLGIDLDAVRHKVEEAFGPGALERARAARHGGPRLLGGRRRGSPGGHVPFSARAKKALELSLREALRLHHDYIGTEHLLLGLLREGDGLAAWLLTRAGVDHATAEAHVRAATRLPDTG